MTKPAYEVIDHRYLGAIRFLNSTTGSEIKRPLEIKAPDLKLFTNLSKKWVIAAAKGLESHLDKFVSPPTPPPASAGPGFFSETYELEISDPAGEFLTRKASIKLPRNLHSHEADNIFIPVDIELYPAPVITAAPNWNVVRVSIQDDRILAATVATETINGIQKAKRLPVAGAWLRVLKAGENQPVKYAISDERGEAIILLSGLPVTSFSSPEEEPAVLDHEEHNENLATGAVVQLTTSFTVEVVVNPAPTWPVDPVEMEDHAQDQQWSPAVQWRDGKTAQIDSDSALKTTPVVLVLESGERQTLELYVKLANTA